MWKNLLEKIDKMDEHMKNFSREMETVKKNQILELKNIWNEDLIRSV